MEKKRNYGLDLLKTLSMFMVISFHFSDHGCIPLSSEKPLTVSWVILAIPRIWGGLCNIIFMLVSGYFLCQKKSFSLKNVFKLYGQVWFYSFFCGVGAILLGTHVFSTVDFIKMLLPFTFNRYWYFSSYILIYLFHPFFNRLINSMNQKQHLWLCYLSVGLFSVYYTVTHAEWIIGTNRLFIFIAMYFVGAYIKKYNINYKRLYIIFFACSLFVIEIASLIIMKFVSYKLKNDNLITYFVWGTERIFPVLLAILLFILFEKKQVSSKIITTLLDFFSPALFGVYLFHVGDLNVWLFQVLFNDSKTYGAPLCLVFQMLIAMVTIFLTGSLIDKMRVFILEKPIMKLLKKHIEHLDNLTSFL